MQTDQFKKWLENNTNFKTNKQISDTVSRAYRIESTFISQDKDFSLDNEFKKDMGISFLETISNRGTKINFENNLPIGKDSFRMLKMAVKKYFIFLSEIKDKNR